MITPHGKRRNGFSARFVKLSGAKAAFFALFTLAV
jgi:hypothetical protein